MRDRGSPSVSLASCCVSTLPCATLTVRWPTNRVVVGAERAVAAPLATMTQRLERSRAKLSDETVSREVATVQLEGSHFAIDIALEASHNVAIVTHRRQGRGERDWVGQVREGFLALWAEMERSRCGDCSRVPLNAVWPLLCGDGMLDALSSQGSPNVAPPHHKASRQQLLYALFSARLGSETHRWSMGTESAHTISETTALEAAEAAGCRRVLAAAALLIRSGDSQLARQLLPFVLDAAPPSLRAAPLAHALMDAIMYPAHGALTVGAASEGGAIPSSIAVALLEDEEMVAAARRLADGEVLHAMMEVGLRRATLPSVCLALTPLQAARVLLFAIHPRRAWDRLSHAWLS